MQSCMIGQESQENQEPPFLRARIKPEKWKQQKQAEMAETGSGSHS